MANFLKYVSAKYLLAIAIVGLCFVPPTCAHDNGMDMTMDGAMSLAEGQMLPYLHFTPGDNLWFLGWVPASTGAMVGTCIGLFLLALVERWVATCRAVMEVHWRKRAQIIQSDRMNLPVSADSKGQQTPSITSVRSAVTMRGAPPFIFAHDITRGILHVGQTALQFAFMLAVMTFQAGFIFAIVVGLGVGEALFGRRFAQHRLMALTGDARRAAAQLCAMRSRADFIFFWKTRDEHGWAVQWYRSPFTACIALPHGEREITFTTAEHWMMAQKALLFGDIVSFELIVEDPRSSPRAVKALGRRVQGFDEDIWNRALREKLLATGDKILVEASSKDRIWGIGFAEKHAMANQERWGLNLLGKALMDVRKMLREQDALGTGCAHFIGREIMQDKDVRNAGVAVKETLGKEKFFHQSLFQPNTGDCETVASLQQYNSYLIDPQWQRKFSIIWACGVGIAVVASLPYLVRSIKNGRAYRGLFGVTEDIAGRHYTSATSAERDPGRAKRRLSAICETAWSFTFWSIPGIELDLGQMLVIAGYLVLVIICITMNAPLIDNPNRAGFMALAQFPVVFLFATKNSILSLLLGPGHGYEKLNYIHRWAGRGMFIGATVHGALWINNHIVFGIPIIGQQKETSGVAAFGVLCVIVLTSFRPVRRYLYQSFFIVHVLGYVAFFITICYHTIYAAPWIFPPLAFYGFDMLLRMFRYRIKDATLVPVDRNMTLINVHDCHDGWVAGQHVRLRVFFSGRVFESHPLTIINAPSSSSCLSGNSLLLAARVKGDWTRALNAYAADEQIRLQTEKSEQPGIPIQVMLDGPYGGCSIDLGSYESVLLLAGGSGATFTLGLLDDIVGRCVKLGRQGGEKTRRIEFAWCIRSFACIQWFAPMLMDIATAVAGSSLDLHVSIYVTCLCNPEDVPPIPNSDVTTLRPSVSNLLRELVTAPSSPSIAEVEEDSTKDKLNWVGLGGGVAVCAAGPESLTRETQNAVANWHC
ncbi:Ferric reductase transmembrane component 3 [Grifola frondosa]|uniref:Ferric reductase transmembrane component 3 n=1 Tax=Grifola frondosa TaxID=5627 RepID=A0A1C7MCM0_GRIFR|nr:Ferric reductase transmembrane component 3 [Grifola frondosa]